VAGWADRGIHLMAHIELDDTAIDEMFDEVLPRDLERRGMNVENKAKRLVAAGGHGRVYDTYFFTDEHGQVRPIGHRPPHRASAPGEPPASDTGLLLNSIHHEMGDDGDGWYVDVGSDLQYAIYLEFGTRKMAPRPLWKAALAAAGDETGLVNEFGEEMF
jgi:hypothetical protein